MVDNNLLLALYTKFQMAGYYRINILTKLGLSELIEKVGNAIDLEYHNKIGTAQLDEKYYGDKINDRTFKVWRKPDLNLGFFNLGFTSHFFILLDEQLLTLEISRSWVFRVISYIVVSIIVIGLADQIAPWPFWITILGLAIAFLFHHIILELTNQSIKEDFKRLIE